MINWLLLLALVGSVFGLCLLSKRPFEQMLAPFAFGLTLVCFALAMFRALAWVQWLALGFALCVWALFLLRNKPSDWLRCAKSNLLTPGLVCFVLLVACYRVGCVGHTVNATDDIYYWGIEAHSVYANQGLVDSIHHLSPRFMTYTPGMQLFQWVGLAIAGEWSESTAYLMLWVFYAICLLPFAERITWKRFYLIPLFAAFALMLPCVLNRDAYLMLRVDTALGLCMGYALLQVWQLKSATENERFRLVTFALALCMLSLIKQVGIGWSLMAIALLAFVYRPCRRARRVGAIVACLSPFLVFGCWKLFCSVMNLSGAHLGSAGAKINALLQGDGQVLGSLLGMPAYVWQALTATSAGVGLSGGALLDVPKLVWIALLALAIPAVVWLQSSNRRLARRVALWLLICSVMFFISYCFTVVIAINVEAESGSVINDFFYLLTERYGCPYLIGLLMLLCFILCTGDAGMARQNRRRSVVLGCVMVAFTLLCCPVQSLFQALSPAFTEESDSTRLLETMMAETEWKNDIEEPQNAIVLYGAESDPFKPEWMQYALAPTKLVLSPSADMDAEAFQELLRKNQITHVYCVDDYNTVYDNAVSYTEDEYLDVMTVYGVCWQDDGLALQ